MPNFVNLTRASQVAESYPTTNVSVSALYVGRPEQEWANRCANAGVCYIPPGFGSRYAAELGSDLIAAAATRERRHNCMWNRIDRAKRQRKRKTDLAPISKGEARAFIKDLCGVLGAWAVVQLANKQLESEVADVFIAQLD